MTKEKQANEEMPNKYSILIKLGLIRDEMPSLQKDARNDFHKYDYVSEAQVMNAFKKLCVEHSVLVIPKCAQVQDMGDISRAFMEYQFIDLENCESHVTISMPADGHDKTDKRLPKAYASSYKYMVMKTFQLSTGRDDVEDDSEEDDEPHEHPAAKDAARLQPKPAIEKHNPTFPEVCDYKIQAACSMQGKSIYDIHTKEPAWIDNVLLKKSLRDKLTPKDVAMLVQFNKESQESLKGMN